MAKQQHSADGRIVPSQSEVAKAFGVERSTVGTWITKGMPGRRGAFDLVAIAKWYRVDGPGADRVADVDPLLAAGASPALERYRLAKAQLAELDLAQRKGQLVDVAILKNTLGRWAAIWRRVGERMGKRYGTDGTEIFNEALDSCRVVIREIEQNDTSTNSV